eukprot:TRINITY_DN13949_c0_g1_i1.p1 TRINITY_DN13949_c0_g1~~TRINITY_DN13949_c0_g1_i1.p1  ORF type:complete len:257 (-),score=-16.27 TRINITY_DN13949_c0_g1_i1:301-1071(-)
MLSGHLPDLFLQTLELRLIIAIQFLQNINSYTDSSGFHSIKHLGQRQFHLAVERSQIAFIQGMIQPGDQPLQLKQFYQERRFTHWQSLIRKSGSVESGQAQLLTGIDQIRLQHRILSKRETAMQQMRKIFFIPNCEILADQAIDDFRQSCLIVGLIKINFGLVRQQGKIQIGSCQQTGFFTDREGSYFLFLQKEISIVESICFIFKSVDVGSAGSTRLICGSSAGNFAKSERKSYFVQKLRKTAIFGAWRFHPAIS